LSLLACDRRRAGLLELGNLLVKLAILDGLDDGVVEGRQFLQLAHLNGIALAVQWDGHLAGCSSTTRRLTLYRTK